MEKKPGGCVLPNVVLIWKAWVVLFFADAVAAAVVAADASNQINKLIIWRAWVAQVWG